MTTLFPPLCSVGMPVAPRAGNECATSPRLAVPARPSTAQIGLDREASVKERPGRAGAARGTRAEPRGAAGSVAGGGPFRPAGGGEREPVDEGPRPPEAPSAVAAAARAQQEKPREQRAAGVGRAAQVQARAVRKPRHGDSPLVADPPLSGPPAAVHPGPSGFESGLVVCSTVGEGRTARKGEV
jgi:hypothetical protein